MESDLQAQTQALIDSIYNQAEQRAMLTIAIMMLKMGITQVHISEDDAKRATEHFIVADEQPDGSWILKIHSTDTAFQNPVPPSDLH